MVYKPTKIDFTNAQIQKMIQQKRFRVTAHQIGKGSKVILLHPANHKIVSKGAMAGTGCVMNVAPGEILATHESD